ncbi:hypothetical protein M514_02101 [Trichuris suis]|uniref:Uncharacterized protein n=1 Tax=Trichuris suis TaxID=68888 RepID=A0A085MHZ8_9BILA|nr:hypothetical protein M513_02101 [Trichuris suis]KFD70580.1 hypothetical protein M514_02101 [Trichuris suis]KHJ47389.1 hypothetical protein D918_02249 [Trichuris suis]
MDAIVFGCCFRVTNCSCYSLYAGIEGRIKSATASAMHFNGASHRRMRKKSPLKRPTGWQNLTSRLNTYLPHQLLLKSLPKLLLIPLENPKSGTMSELKDNPEQLNLDSSEKLSRPKFSSPLLNEKREASLLKLCPAKSGKSIAGVDCPFVPSDNKPPN